MNTKQIKLMFAGALAASVALGLCACNDETTGASGNSNSMSVLDAGKTLGGCSKDNAGEMVYVSDSSAVYYCAEGEWQTLNGKDGKDGENGKDGSNGKDGANGKDGVNGVDGKNGTDGVDGKDGTDGKDGENGVNGENGSSGVSTKDTIVIRDTVVLNNRDTVVVNKRDTVVVVKRDTIVIKEPSSSNSNSSSSSCATSLVGKANWVYLNPSICYGEMTDERDGQIYKTVKIGNQTWMAENLNIEYKVDGKTYGIYTADSLKDYGYYYTWAAAMDSAGVYSTNGKGCGKGDSDKCSLIYPVRGVCPEGWHVPNDTEWDELYKTVGDSDDVLLAVGFSRWSDATDDYGFSALPAGMEGGMGVGGYTYFWTAYQKDSEDLGVAYRRRLKRDSMNVSDKNRRFSVRCLKDSAE